MKAAVVLVGFITIFISMFFSLVLFDSFSHITSSCPLPECPSSNLSFILSFGSFIIGGFVVIDCIVAYIIVQVKRSSAKPSIKERVEQLKAEYEDLKRAKLEAQKRYFSGRIEIESLKKMLDRYECKMIVIDSRIKNIKSEAEKKPKGRK
jgi:di/tripeptidase